MKQLTCEMCGSNDLIKQNGVFVCQTCGCKYSLEEAKKMFEITGTVTINRNSEFDNLFMMANNAYNSGHPSETIKYINKIHEIDLSNTDAWCLKAKAVCAMFRETFLEGMNQKDLILSWQNAVLTNKGDKKELEERIFNDFVNEYLVNIIAFKETFIRKNSEFRQKDLNRIVRLIQGLRELLETKELSFLKNRIPKYKDGYEDGLIEYFAAAAFKVIKEVISGINAMQNVERRYKNRIYSHEKKQDNGLYLLGELLKIAKSNDTKAYICELLAFSHLHYPFGDDEYELLDELDSNHQCRKFYDAMTNYSSKYTKKYADLKEKKKESEIKRKQRKEELRAKIDRLQHKIYQRNEQDYNIRNEISELENSFLKFLSQGKINSLKAKLETLREKNAIDSKKLDELKNQFDGMNNIDLMRSKSILRAQLEACGDLMPEAAELSRTIAKLGK